MHREAADAARPARYLALGVVLALHLGLIAAMLVASRFREVSPSTARPLEILLLSPESRPAVVATPANRAARVIPGSRTDADLPPDAASHRVAPAAADSGAGSDQPSQGPSVDWDQEAKSVAADQARTAAALSAADAVRELKSNSPFAPPPAHHAGEEFTTSTGQRAVYVNADCYQVASPFWYSPNASNNGMGMQTYCNRMARTPRGDLFDQLPAYRKYHPGD